MKYELKSNKKYNIKINFDKKVENIMISGDATTTELGILIYNKFLLNHLNYTIFYKNKKLGIDDLEKVSYYFEEDPNPFLFIINNKLLSPDCKQSRSVYLTSNLNEKSLKDLVGKFFELKSLPFSVNIKLLMGKKYRIRFTRPLLANEFIQFYNIFNEKKTYKKIEPGLLPKLKFNKSSDIILEKNSREKSLSNVINTNNKDSLISFRTVNSGRDVYHPCYLKQINTIQKVKNKKYKIKLEKHLYKGSYNFPFLNPDQKYYRDKYLDKKNWMDKKGFIASIGNYKMGGSGSSFISNYVSATPSKSPLIHNFREVNKNKWINKKGFFS